MKRCRRRGHRWVVIGIDATVLGGTGPLVFLECRRCPASMTTEIVEMRNM